MPTVTHFHGHESGSKEEVVHIHTYVHTRTFSATLGGICRDAASAATIFAQDCRPKIQTRPISIRVITFSFLAVLSLLDVDASRNRDVSRVYREERHLPRIAQLNERRREYRLEEDAEWAREGTNERAHGRMNLDEKKRADQGSPLPSHCRRTVPPRGRSVDGHSPRCRRLGRSPRGERRRCVGKRSDREDETSDARADTTNERTNVRPDPLARTD